METLKIDLAKLHNEEHFQFQTEFKESVEKFNVDNKLNIKFEFDDYRNYYEQEKEALLLVRKNPATDDMVIADNERDSTFRGFGDAIKSGLNHFDTLKVAAAHRVQVTLDQYGNIARKPYDEETAAINKLVEETGNTLTSDITLLGLNEWVVKLDEKNKAFDKLMKGRYSEEASKTQLRMKLVRIQVDSAYRGIADRLDALMLINGAEEYQPFILEFNERVSRYKTILAQRAGRAAKEREQPDANTVK